MTKKMKPQKSYKIYALLDENEVPFYVGVTSQSLAQRKSEHVYGARHNRGKNKTKESRIMEILDSGHKVTIELLEGNIKTLSEADLAESMWIAEYKAEYASLTNVSPGSDFYLKYTERCDVHSNNFLTPDIAKMTPQPNYKVVVTEGGNIIDTIETIAENGLQAIENAEKTLKGKAKEITVFLSGKGEEVITHDALFGKISVLNFNVSRIV